MAVMREDSFRDLDPAQAAELSLLLDLEAQWQNLLKASAPAPEGSILLHGKQKAYEAFHNKLVAYNKQYPPGHVPEPSLNSPSRLGAWCSAMRNLYRQAERSPQSRCPVHLLERAYWCADRIGSRMNIEAVSRAPRPDTIGAVIAGLETLIRWCDNLTTTAQAG